ESSGCSHEVRIPALSRQETARQGRAPSSKVSPYPVRKVSEHEADAAGDEVGPPVVNLAGIAQVRLEFEVAGFVGGFGVPLAENVSHAAPDVVPVIEAGIGQRVIGHGGLVVRSEF